MINKKSKDNYIEIISLFLIAIVIFILSTLQVKDMVSIWNQNDEFGVWQGGAWLLGLDWTEVTSTNGFYGYGYGFILAIFIKVFGHDTILMTQMAVYFQALMHTGCIFIARYCIEKLFPKVGMTTRIIAASVCILTVPDLFYIYTFFSECLLRFLVWMIFGGVVSYYCNKRWYKIIGIDFVAIYAFSVHQRCILLIAVTFMLTLYEIIVYLKENGINILIITKVIFSAILIIGFYYIVYKYMQQIYIDDFYSMKDSGVGGNLLSERGYTIKSILKDIVFNKETHKIAIQNGFGFVYYIGAIDCGFVFYGFIHCFRKIKETFLKKEKENIMPYLFSCIVTLGGILLVVYQQANEWVYMRVEAMHYGRYCSYLFAPMIMLGIIELLTQTSSVVRKNAIYVLCIFLSAGLVTYNVLKFHNVTNLFAFPNACPGILSIYYDENPYQATLYHTIIGGLWIILPALGVWMAKKRRTEKYIQIGLFLIISLAWVTIANREWRYTKESHNNYVMQTYDLQNILKGEEEFIVYKSFSYGSGLLQYNNLFSKIYVCNELEEFGNDEDGLLVVSQKGIDEMNYILQKYSVAYENDRYFVWRYEK